MKQYVERSALHLKGGAETTESVPLIVEEPLEIWVNGAPYAVLMRTPGYELELAAGFCLTEGIVDSFQDILSIGFCPNETDELKNVVQVVVRKSGNKADITSHAPRHDATRALPSRSSCGLCGVRMLEDLEKGLSPLGPGPQIDYQALVNLQYGMLNQQDLFRSTWGGTHAVALANARGEIIVVREDLGRHNAMDKVIGYAMQNGIDCRECVALISGRISFEMVQKSVRAGIPVVAAISAATSLAVDLAEKTGCTLVGRLRDQDMVIYTHPNRIHS